MQKRMVALAASILFALLRPASSSGFMPIPAPVPSAAPTAGLSGVPAAYRGLYSYLQNAIGQTNKILDSVDKGQHNPVTFGTELLPANGNTGLGLLAPKAIQGVEVYLDALKALNVQGVTVAVSYPLTLSRFPNSGQYQAFYEQVAQEVRSRGMKLDVETGPIFPDQGIRVSYRGLTVNQYAKDKNQIAQTIIDEMQPDYLNLGAEPDTEAKLLGIPQLNTAAGWTSYMTKAMQGLNRRSTKVAGGIGTWNNIAIAKSLAKTDLDTLVIHFYPIIPQFVTTAIQVAALAHQSGKSAILDETWLYKTRQVANADYYSIFKLDAFSFWAPLDQQWIAAMVRLSRLEDFEFVSPFWSNYFFAYLDYTPQLGGASYNTVRAAAFAAAAQALENGATTSTGQFYANLVSP